MPPRFASQGRFDLLGMDDDVASSSDEEVVESAPAPVPVETKPTEVAAPKKK